MEIIAAAVIGAIGTIAGALILRRRPPDDEGGTSQT